MKIPERYRAGIRVIQRLDGKSVRVIAQVLEGAGLAPSPTKDTAKPGGLAGLRRGDLEEVLKAINSLYRARSALDVGVEEFVGALSEAVQGVDGLRMPRSRLAGFKKKMRALLGVGPYGTHVKAQELRTADERTFCDARIVTDLRPVFGTDVQEGAKGVVIVHQLEVGYHEGGKEHRKFFVALDAEDLAALRSALERAEAKEEALRLGLGAEAGAHLELL